MQRLEEGRRGNGRTPMSHSRRRNAYSDAIERVRSQHRENVAPARLTVECPMCKTKQVIVDAPGMRRCVSCGYEFRERR